MPLRRHWAVVEYVYCLYMFDCLYCLTLIELVNLNKVEDGKKIGGKTIRKVPATEHDGIIGQRTTRKMFIAL